MSMLLTPLRGILTALGKLGYSESVQAWNTIRLPKLIIDQFPLLKQKRGKFSFKIDFPRNTAELKEVVEISEKEKKIPLLLYLYLDEPIE